MGWQDAPVIDQQAVPAAPPAQGQQPAWAAAPVVKAEHPTDIKALASAKAQKYQLDPRMFSAQVGTESSWDTNATSPKGARGLGQLMPATAKELGVTDPADPEQNLEASAKYMRSLLDKYGNNYDQALAAYNWGMGNVDRNGMGNLPDETRKYIAKIKGQSGDRDVPMPGVVGDTFSADPATPKTTSVSVPENEYLRTAKRVGLGLEKGIVQDLPQAVAQMAGTVIPDSVQRSLSPNGGTINEYVEEKNQAYEKARKELGGEGIDLSRLAGNLGNPANYIGGELAQAPAWFAKMSPKAQAIFKSMAVGGTAAAGQPVDTREQSVLAGKAQQVATGAALGPAAEGAARLVTKGAGQLVGAARNELAPRAQQMQQLGDQYGVRMSAGDLDRQRKFVTGIEGALENNRLPGMSMAPVRQQQQAQSQAAAQGLVDEQFKKLHDMTFQNLPAIQAAAASGGKRQGEAAKILQMVDAAGTDEKAIMQASGNMTWLRKKLSADKLYDDVARIAGDAEVAPTDTLKNIDDAIKRAQTAVDKDPTALALLGKWKQQLSSPVAPAPGAEEAGAQLVPNTYARMAEFKSDVYKLMDESTTNGITDSSKLFMKDIVKGVQNDMDNFAQATPALAEANERANSFYQRQVVPYSKPTLAKALTNEDPDMIYGAFVRSQAEGKGDYAAKRFWAALDDKGRQAVRYGIVNNAMKNSLEDGQFSPVKFKKFVENTEYGNYFRGPEKTRVDGMVKLFGALDRATPEHLEKYQAIFGGSAQSVGLGALAGSTGVAGLAAGAGTAGFLRWLMTSDAGKRVLFSTNVLAKGGSKEQMGKLLDRAATEYGRAAGSTAGAEQGQHGRVLP